MFKRLWYFLEIIYSPKVMLDIDHQQLWHILQSAFSFVSYRLVDCNEISAHCILEITVITAWSGHWCFHMAVCSFMQEMVKETVQLKIRYTVIIYSALCSSKNLWLPFHCGTQKETFWRNTVFPCIDNKTWLKISSLKPPTKVVHIPNLQKIYRNLSLLSC